MKKEESTYKMEKPPHLHIGLHKNELMWKTFLMMCIIALASVIIMGLEALIHILVAIGTVLIVNSSIYSYQVWKGKEPTYESPASPLVAGMIVGLAMPIAGPYEVTAGVALLTILVFKYGQGRYFKRKYLNPAATSKVLLLGLLSIMFFLEDPLDTGMLFHTHHYDWFIIEFGSLANADGFKEAVGFFSRDSISILGIYNVEVELTAAQGLLLWQTHGWIGGASSVVVLIVGTVSAYWLRFKWRIIASMLTTMTVISVATGLYLGGDPILRIAFHVFTGSVIFLMFFMATEPQSTPMPERSQYIFGMTLAILTFVLQLLNVLGGSVIALVILNMATPYLDKIGIKTPYGHKESDGGA